MLKRLNAFRIVFNFLLSLVELLIGVHFLLNLFGSAGSSNTLLEIFKLTLEQSGVFVSQFAVDCELGVPTTFLLLVLAFMFFSFVLITAVPTMVERKEKELELAEEEYF